MQLAKVSIWVGCASAVSWDDARKLGEPEGAGQYDKVRPSPRAMDHAASVVSLPAEGGFAARERQATREARGLVEEVAALSVDNH